MNIAQEINLHLSACTRATEGPQHKKDIEGLTRFIEKVARKRLEDLEEFVNGLDELPVDSWIHQAEITQQIVNEFNELNCAIGVAEGVLGTCEG